MELVLILLSVAMEPSICIFRFLCILGGSLRYIRLIRLILRLRFRKLLLACSRVISKGLSLLYFGLLVAFWEL